LRKPLIFFLSALGLTSSSAMVERPHKLRDSKVVDQFGAKF